MNSRKIFVTSFFVLSIIPQGWFLLQPQAHAYTKAPDEPNFVVLLESQPIVALVKIDKMVKKSSKKFAAVASDLDKSPEFSEEYHHYRFQTVKSLKGDLPEQFEVRLLSSDKKLDLLKRPPSKEMLLILAPDYGLDSQGQPRTSYLITHGAAYPVINNRFAVPTAKGQENWSIEQTLKAIRTFDKERKQRRAESPESPKAATVPVSAGQITPKAEPIPPPGPAIPGRDLSPPKRLAKAAPKAFIGAVHSTPRWQADLQVKQIQAKAIEEKEFNCLVKIKNQGDDDARETTVRVILPPGVKFLGSKKCTPSNPGPASTNNTRGFASCNLGQMGVGQSDSLAVTATLPPDWSNKTCAAFVWSITPDPLPGNNYKEVTLE